MSDKDIVWLAGILEGEGCFCYDSSPGIKIGMTDKDVVEKIASLFKRHIRGPYKYKSNRKPVYYTEVWSHEAISIMTKILPYMGQRRTLKIEEIIKKFKTAPGKNHNLGKSKKCLCHPNEKHYAHEMCRSCYRKDRWAKKLKR